jgi:hypothetical protein
VRTGKLRRTTPHRDGYDKINLTNAAGVKKTHHVHQLIALTFLGPRPAGHFIDHIDGDHTNHAAWNLRYLSPAESSLNRKKRGDGKQFTGVPCVRNHALGGYFVRVQIAGKKYRLGRFDSLERAASVAMAARKKKGTTPR